MSANHHVWACVAVPAKCGKTLVLACANNALCPRPTCDTQAVQKPRHGELQGKQVVQVAAGDQHSACVTKDGLVYMLGDSSQLGQEGVDDANLPVLVQALDDNANVNRKLE